MKCFKNWFPIFLSIFLIILSVCPTNGEKSSSSSKARKRYRSHLSVVSKTEQDQFPKSNFSAPETSHNETLSDFYPTSTVSRALPSPQDFTSGHHRSGIISEDREEDLFQPFTDFGSWGSQPQSQSSPTSPGSKHTSSKESYPSGSPRHGLTSAEKFDKYGSTNNGDNSFGSLFPGTSAGQIYSSYPLGVGGGGISERYQSSSPILDTYPYYEKEREKEIQKQRAARDLLLNAAAVSKLNALHALHSGAGVNPALSAAASSLYANSVVAPDFDGYGDALALASGGHGHGWGWGWKEPQHHHDHGSDMNTSAVGLLGLLGLLSLLSNILLILLTTTTTAAGRRKRSTSGIEFNESEEAKRTRIFYQLLPYLSPVAHARNGLIPTECTLQGVCLSNKVLALEYGLMGRSAGNRVTSGIAKLLSEINISDDHRQDIVKAGLHGRNQRNCQKVYPVCKHMQNYGHLNVPFMIRMEELPHLFERLKKQTSYSPMNL